MAAAQLCKGRHAASLLEAHRGAESGPFVPVASQFSDLCASQQASQKCPAICLYVPGVLHLPVLCSPCHTA